MLQMNLVWPSLEYLPGYVAALKRGWSSDNERGEIAAQEELGKIAADAKVFPMTIAVATMLALFQASVPTQLAPVKSVNDSEAYVVYASLLPNEWIVTAAHAKRLVLQRETATRWGCMPAGKQFDAEWRAVIDNFKAENAGVVALLPDYPLGLPYLLVPSAQIQALFHAPGYEWEEFNRMYPDSGGYMQVSAVGFDNSKTHAMVYMAHQCGSLCGGGMHHVLEKIEGAWRAARVPGMTNCSWNA
jgi:hypothetical protein